MGKTFQEIKYLLEILITLLAALGVSRLLRNALTRYFNRSSARLRVNPTNYVFIKNASSFVVFGLALIIIFHLIPGLEKVGNTLLASAGIVSVVLGLAAQQAFGNIISGLFIVIYKPFRVGDLIYLSDGNAGIVEDITLRHTVLSSPEYRQLVIPNSVIGNQTISNAMAVSGQVSIQLDVTLNRTADVKQAIDLIQQTIQQHPDFVDSRSEKDIANQAPAVVVRLLSYSEASLQIRAYLWSNKTETAFALKSVLLFAVERKLKEAGM